MPADVRWWVFVALATAAALLLRLDDLELKSIAHTEIYVPGIPLPEGLTEPPARLTLRDVLWFHFHDEPHPMGWYLMMFGWTGLAGTSEWALRLPSALFGAASVPAVFLLTRRIFGTPAAALAAALLAAHGFHVYWSQAARMYVPGAFWAMLSTWLLVTMAQSRGPRPLAEAGYVLATLAGLQTTELCLPVLLVQVVWASLFLAPAPAPGVRVALRGRPTVPRVLQVQAIALMLSVPGFAQAIYRARKEAAAPPSLEFLQEYLSFGFLYAHEAFASPEIRLAAPLVLALAVAGIAAIVAGLRAGRPERGLKPASRPLPRWLAPVVAVSAAALVLWFAAIAHRRNGYLLVLAAFPVAGLAVPRLALAARAAIVALAGGHDGWLRRRDPFVALLAVLGLLLPLALFAVSFRASVLAPRAFLVLVPYLLVLAAGGVAAGLRPAALRAAAAAGLTALFALSVPFNAAKPISPNDYKSLAFQLRAAMQPGDVIFLRARQWADSPLLYYLRDVPVVTENQAADVAAGRYPRLWLVTWPDDAGKVRLGPRQDAVAGLTPVSELRALRARAVLYVPGPAP